MAGPGNGWDGPAIDDHPVWTVARTWPRWARITVPVLALGIPVVMVLVLAAVFARRAGHDAAATATTRRAALITPDTPSAVDLAATGSTIAVAPVAAVAGTAAPTTRTPTTAAPATTAVPPTTGTPQAPAVAAGAGGALAVAPGAGAALATPPGAAAPPSTASPPPATVVSYANCAAVRAAGKAPLYRGQPGYALHLDRDRDGVACES